MKTSRFLVLAVLVLTAALVPTLASAQMPSIGSMLPDKATLLEQGKKLLADLTAMKQDPNTSAADKSKLDTMIPKATSVNTELAKPQVEPSKLTQLASQLGDLQKQYAALKGH